MNSSSTLPPLPMLLQLDLEATTVLEANRPQKPLKNCWASEAPQGALLHLAHWVGQWQHHNLHPFPHPCNQSQARTLHPSRALEAPVVEGFLAGGRISTTALVRQSAAPCPLLPHSMHACLPCGHECLGNSHIGRPAHSRGDW